MKIFQKFLLIPSWYIFGKFLKNFENLKKKIIIDKFLGKKIAILHIKMKIFQKFLLIPSWDIF